VSQEKPQNQVSGFAVKGEPAILQNPNVRKSLQNLTRLGLRGEIVVFDDNWACLAISADSIIDAMKRMVARAITYPKNYVEYDKETGFLLVHFWKGETPQKLVNKMFRIGVER